jgi:hypothetical protein
MQIFPIIMRNNNNGKVPRMFAALNSKGNFKINKFYLFILLIL